MIKLSAAVTVETDNVLNELLPLSKEVVRQSVTQLAELLWTAHNED